VHHVERRTTQARLFDRPAQRALRPLGPVDADHDPLHLDLRRSLLAVMSSMRPRATARQCRLQAARRTFVPRAPGTRRAGWAEPLEVAMTLATFLDYLHDHEQSRELAVALHDVLVLRGVPGDYLRVRWANIAIAG
jgi:hypothetical protein